MILVDTSVWVRHLRYVDETLTELLNAEEVLAHPFVIGELALGNLRQRDLVLSSLQELPQASVASHEEVLQLIHAGGLFGTGIGYVDAHLLASARLAVGATLWTRDKRLRAAASKLRLEWRGESERPRYG